MENIETKPITDAETEEGRNIWLRMLKENPNNFSNWYPNFVASGRLRTPKSVGYRMPDELFSCTFLENPDDIERLLEWIEREILPSILSDFPKESNIFFKNGCFSNKFDFANSCLITPEEKTAEGILRHILNIEEPALCFDTRGYLEFVAREWIQPMPGTPTIYNGMPLRPEIRVFYDFGTKELLYDKFYWDWDYCSPRILGTEDADEYSEAYPVIENEYLANRSWALEEIKNALATVEEMEGIWSIDFLLNRTENGYELWMIDAADAWESAYWDPELANQ
jgi:hypothetical protein